MHFVTKRQVLPRIWPTVAAVGLLVLPVASCTSRGTVGEHTLAVTGLELLRNRSAEAEETSQVLRWSVIVGTNMARAHPAIGYEGPLPGAPPDVPVDLEPETLPSKPVRIFKGPDQWLRVLYAAVLAVTFLGLVLRFRPVRYAILGVMAALGLVLFLWRTEEMVRGWFGYPASGLEVRWMQGAYLALLAFSGMVITGLVLQRRAVRRVLA